MHWLGTGCHKQPVEVAEKYLSNVVDNKLNFESHVDALWF